MHTAAERERASDLLRPAVRVSGFGAGLEARLDIGVCRGGGLSAAVVPGLWQGQSAIKLWEVWQPIEVGLEQLLKIVLASLLLLQRGPGWRGYKAAVTWRPGTASCSAKHLFAMMRKVPAAESRRAALLT